MSSRKKSSENPLGLDPVQGCAVTAVGMEITNAGGGFQDPLEIDESVIETIAKVQIGDTIYGLMRLDCVKFRYQPRKGYEDQLQYVPIFRCTDATPVEPGLGAQMINEQRDIIMRLREQAEGTQRLPFDGDGGENGGLSLVDMIHEDEADAQ